MRTIPLLAFAALTLAMGHLACGSSSTNGHGPASGSTGASSATGTSSASGSSSTAGLGGASGSSGASSASGSSSGGGSDAGCSPSGVFQCPPPSAGCPAVDAGGQPFLMCNLGEICLTTDGCDLSVPGTGCIAAPTATSCSCAAFEAALPNMGCPQTWVANASNKNDTPATGCTIDCN